tara:strand:+ start:452 stop:607 length:156 start_codon:yes stop_codon:yes gene_type:complete
VDFLSEALDEFGPLGLDQFGSKRSGGLTMKNAVSNSIGFLSALALALSITN